MEELIQKKINLFILVELILLVSIVMFSRNINAKGPDFDRVVALSLNLSGTRIEMNLPSRLDKDFPVYPPLNNINIFDQSKYNGVYYEELLFRRHWDYRGYFWQGLAGRFAMMNLTVGLARLPDNTDVNMLSNILPLVDIIREDIEGEYLQDNIDTVNNDNIIDKHIIKFDLSFDWLEIDTLKILVCTQVDNHPFSKYKEIKNFYLPVSDQHYLIFSFTTAAIGKNRGENIGKWHPQSGQDIENIVKSLKVQYP